MEIEEIQEVQLEEPSPLPVVVKEPPMIHRLDESVVNRIAAGEVIQRPVSAVKELIENSLDADSTSINVVVKDGGLKLIQVSDDGHGIRYEDLPILCERHTTSKLCKFEDLQSIKSMGFRGEALASMTYVGHVTVTTITKGLLHGYRVSYRDGVMEHEPKACAAVKGTQIMIENLFYNMTARRKTLQNSADDYPKIVDLLSRFAIHHINVSFSCRKHGAARADVHSVATASRLDAIRSVYGVSVARNLMKIEVSDDDPSSSVFEMDGFISNSNYVAKKITMVLFINDRLVECSALKRAIEIVYAATLPKASKPFIYMSVLLPPEHVDVNVHPTKREVSLLNQEVVIEKIQSAVESKLRNSNEARTFQEQVVDPSPSSPMLRSKDSPINPSASGTKLQKVPVHKMVRTDSLDPAGRLHAYLQVKPSSHHENNSSLTSVRSSIRQRRNPKEAADLTSIQELIDDIDNKCHSALLDIVRHCTYIGMADDVFALLQHNTHLFLANMQRAHYQQVLRGFAHFNAIQLSDPAPLPELIMLALKEEDVDPECNEKDELKEKIAEMNTELLKNKSEMLEEYFCIYVDSQGNLSRLPVILDQYTPDMDRVPEFVLCLGNDVDWEDEKSCFQSIAAALGNFYAMHPPLLPNPSGDGLQIYKRRKPFRSPQAEENSMKNTGYNVLSDVVFAVSCGRGINCPHPMVSCQRPSCHFEFMQKYLMMMDEGGEEPLAAIKVDVAITPKYSLNTDDLQDHIIICGFGRVGQIIAQLLSERLIPFVALDVRRFIVLHKVGAESACAAAITLDNPGANYRTVWALSKYFPNVKTFVCAHDVDHGLILEKAEATAVVPETLEPSLQLAAAVLAQAKLPMSEIKAIINKFRSHHLSELTELSEASGGSLGYGYSRIMSKPKSQPFDSSDDNQITEGTLLLVLIMLYNANVQNDMMLHIEKLNLLHVWIPFCLSIVLIIACLDNFNFSYVAVTKF
ncbi:hypothetical protein HYC85_024085 [Camellia sinensis]|uniref:DNA mismatch repair protein S5 domain-containing protein n=1 Tax=Camellia sinensis TaxID=4442 RepID=A0A7J7G756_CAMSI|nr:hypothetical protein HYC85_024085 [Camellia sinensis]